MRFPLGLISSLRDRPFFIRTSPSSVFCMRWMVIEPIKSAMHPAAICISGLSANLVYPETHNMSYASFESRKLTAELGCPRSVVWLLRFFLLNSYSSSSQRFALSPRSMSSSFLTHANTDASKISILCSGCTLSYWIMSSVFSIALTFCTQYS